MLDAVRTLELANKVHSLYLEQPPNEKAKLLKVVLSNCAIEQNRTVGTEPGAVVTW